MQLLGNDNGKGRGKQRSLVRAIFNLIIYLPPDYYHDDRYDRAQEDEAAKDGHRYDAVQAVLGSAEGVVGAHGRAKARQHVLAAAHARLVVVMVLVTAL